MEKAIKRSAASGFPASPLLTQRLPLGALSLAGGSDSSEDLCFGLSGDRLLAPTLEILITEGQIHHRVANGDRQLVKKQVWVIWGQVADLRGWRCM